MTPIKFYSEGADWSPSDTMSSLLNRQPDMKQVFNPFDADIVVFNGGADIGTSIYGEVSVIRSVPVNVSKRDTKEMNLFKEQTARGAFMLGICRGAQLLNCLNGGSLWQDVDGHGNDHQMMDLTTGKRYITTSTHHQQMIPAKSAEVIAVANESTEKHNEAQIKRIQRPSSIAMGDDVEICWYAQTRSLCIQGHPEYVPHSQFATYCLDLVREKFKEKSNVQQSA